MAVTVRFVGSLRAASGKSMIRIDAGQKAPLREATRKIIKEIPQLKPVLTDKESGNLRTNVLVLVNGKEIGVLKGLDTMLKDGDEVVFVPVSHGG
jgi:molybdopterin synthase sulfur carrier subunit